MFVAVFFNKLLLRGTVIPYIVTLPLVYLVCLTRMLPGQPLNISEPQYMNLEKGHNTVTSW